MLFFFLAPVAGLQFFIDVNRNHASDFWELDTYHSQLMFPPPFARSPFGNMRWVANRSINRSRRASACGVPRGRGVRGAARGLERELRASGRHKKTRNSELERGQAKTAWAASRHAAPHLSTSNPGDREREKDGIMKFKPKPHD